MKAKQVIYVIIYKVKYSELWCSNDCHWIEEVVVTTATSKRQAQNNARKHIREGYNRIIIGRHVATYKLPKSRFLKNQVDY